MNQVQKAIKGLAICLGIVIIVQIVGFFWGIFVAVTHIDFGTQQEVQNFEERYTEIHSIEIESLGSAIIVKEGSEFRVKADNVGNIFSAKAKNGVLKIEEKKKWFGSHVVQGEITVYVPEDTYLNELKIDTGAGRIELEHIISQRLDIDHGAGILSIIHSSFDSTEIDGGAGEIKVSDSTLHNLDLDAGVGKIEIEAFITGVSKIDCGVGEVQVTLLGSDRDYRIKAEKGIGSIKIQGQEQSRDVVYGNGTHQLELEGGVGSIVVDFLSRES